MARFTDKPILITGGTSGIGRATAKRLIAEGARVLVTGHSEGHIAETRDELPNATVIANDAADPAAVAALAGAVRDFAPDGVYGVFLNAGYGAFQDFDAIDADSIDRHYALDLRAPILHAKALGDQIVDQGRMLLIGSGTVGGARVDTLVYSAMKAGIRQAVRSLATRFAPRGITVNAVTPGVTETRFHERGGMGDDAEAGYKAKLAEMILLGRIGQPEDVAAVACFLLSQDAAYVTGAELRVDGGLTMA